MAVRIELNRAGVHAILTGREGNVFGDLATRGINIAAAAGGGRPDADFEVETKVGRNRVHTTVWTANYPAMLAEAEDRALTMAIDAGRL